LQKENNMKTDFVYMGFPRRVVNSSASYVFDGKTPTLADTAYVCPRCFTKTTEIPTQCMTCTLQLNSSSHIARSFHHIFPVPTFVDDADTAPLSDLNVDSNNGTDTMDVQGQSHASSNGSNEDYKICGGCSDTMVVGMEPLYKCPRCLTPFCTECDSFIHDSLHNCPGCGI
jgi:transcription initiation factor TFIIH subunit 2